MSDEISSGEGGGPPEQRKSRGAQRRRKLSGVEARALGELAFKLYEVAAADLPNDQKWSLLRAKLLAWRALYLP